MYETVFNAQKIGFEKIKEGITASEVHKTVENYINTSKFKDRFIHSTGHSLGINVHDGGFRLSSNSELILKENMVFTIEPALRVPEENIYIRCEDLIIIHDDRAEIASDFLPLEIDDVEKLMKQQGLLQRYPRIK